MNHRWLAPILFYSFNLILSNSILSQKFLILSHLETLCKCGESMYSDLSIQTELKQNNEFFLGNAKYTMLALNYYVLKNDRVGIINCLNKLCEFGRVIDETYKSNCKDLYKLDTFIDCNKIYDSTEIVRIAKMFDTEQNIRTFYKSTFGFSSILDIMIKIDSLNMHLIDSLYIKPKKFPQESKISSLSFYKLFLVLFHNVSQLNETEWNEVKSFLNGLLENGTMNANYYAMLVDRYLEKNGLLIYYGEGLSKFGDRIEEVNSNRLKIGLRELNVGCD